MTRRIPPPPPDWKDDLRACFADLKIIEKCRTEAVARFDRFCEYVAVPAFEALAEELDGYGIKTKASRTIGSSAEIEIRFPGSREDQFHYILWLPPNAVDLRLKLTLRGRRSPGGALEEKVVPFLDQTPAEEILRLDKDALAQDVVARYKKFLYDTAIVSD